MTDMRLARRGTSLHTTLDAVRQARRVSVRRRSRGGGSGSSEDGSAVSLRGRENQPGEWVGAVGEEVGDGIVCAFSRITARWASRIFLSPRSRRSCWAASEDDDEEAGEEGGVVRQAVPIKLGGGSAVEHFARGGEMGWARGELGTGEGEGDVEGVEVGRSASLGWMGTRVKAGE